MIVVKLTTEFPHVDLEDLTPQRSARWGDCQFVVNQEIDRCDYWMVIDGLHLPETTSCPPENVFLFTGEPPSIRRYSHAFLRQFAAVITAQPQISHPRLIPGPPPLPWCVNPTYDDALTRPIEKTDLLTMMCSSKQMTAGHRRRYRFAQRLKAHFGDRLQLYGRGIRDVDDKWTVQAPSRYAVVVENSNLPHYFTEKITDCFLTETFPFYDGCPNIGEYFAADSFQTIDIDDFEGTIAGIERTLSDPTHYERHRLALQQAKRDYVRKYSLFALLSQRAVPYEAAQRPVTLVPEHPYFTPTLFRSAVRVVRCL